MRVNDANRNRKLIAVVGLVCGVAQLALVPYLGIAQGRANLCLVAAACLALAIGGRVTVAAGFVAGLVFDLTTTGPVGLMAFELTLASFLLGLEARNRLSDDWSGSLQLFVVCALGVELAYGLAMLLVGQAGDLLGVLGLRTLPSVLLDVVSFVLVGMLCRRLSGSSGHASFGPKPSLGGGRGRHGAGIGRKGR